MKQRLLLVALFSSLLLLGAAGRATQAQVETPARARQVIVRLKSPGDRVRFRLKHAAPIVDGGPDNQTLLVQVAGTNDREFTSIAQDPFVASVELNVDLGLDLNAQWTTAFDAGGGPRHYEGQPLVPQVNDVMAPSLTTGAGVTVAVLDTGISLRHPLLSGKVLPGWNFIDNNANTDDVPANPVGRTLSTEELPAAPTVQAAIADQAVGHGTAVAGVVSVIAPDAKLLPVKILNSDGRGTLWGLIRGIQFAVARGARVLNISVSTPVQSRLLDQTLRDAYQAGALVVASAGNENSAEPRYPAAGPKVVGVAALTNENIKAAFSNFGPTVDVSAPGVDVITTFWDGTYVTWSGTSFSAPIVSGQAALLFALAPDFRSGEVARLIEKTSHSLDELNPDFAGQLGRADGGLVDIDASVAEALRRFEDHGPGDDWIGDDLQR